MKFKSLKRLYTMRLNKNSYVLLWSLILIIQGIFIYNIEKIFPKKYFFDSYTIINAIFKNDYSYFDTSYKIIAKVFSIFPLKTLQQYNMVCYLIFLLFFIWHLCKNSDLKIRTIIFNFIFMALASIYLIRPGKEFLQFIILLFCYRWNKLSPIFLIIGGVLFRKYLIIQGLIFILLKFYLKRKKKILWIVLFLIVGVVISLMIPDYIEKILVEIREYVNRDREGSEYAKSIINSLIKRNGVWYAYLNYTLNTLRLLFPIELLFRNIKYLPYIVFQLWFTKKLWNWKKRLDEKVILLYSFILVSGIFEPDFGSFLRHTVPYLIIVTDLWRKNEKDIIYNK